MVSVSSLRNWTENDMKKCEINFYIAAAHIWIREWKKFCGMRSIKANCSFFFLLLASPVLATFIYITKSQKDPGMSICYVVSGFGT